MPRFLSAITVCGLLVGGAWLEVASSAEPGALAQLEARLAALPATNSEQLVKRAVLELALERARSASAAGLADEARALESDVRLGLPKRRELAARTVQGCSLGDRYLRVVLLEDGETVHNAFFDRRFQEKEK